MGAVRHTAVPRYDDVEIERHRLLEARRPFRETATPVVVYEPNRRSPARKQIAGENDLDGRSDLFALGALGYTMLAGCPPFDGNGPLEVAARQLTSRPPALGELAPEAPAVLVDAIARCLARHPGDRWRDGRSLRDALIGEGVLMKRRWWGRG